MAPRSKMGCHKTKLIHKGKLCFAFCAFYDGICVRNFFLRVNKTATIGPRNIPKRAFGRKNSVFVLYFCCFFFSLLFSLCHKNISEICIKITLIFADKCMFRASYWTIEPAEKEWPMAEKVGDNTKTSAKMKRTLRWKNIDGMLCQYCTISQIRRNQNGARFYTQIIFST